MKTTLDRINWIALVLLAFAAPMSANALLIDVGETLHADFDLSGSTPAPPWDYLRSTIVFDILDSEDDTSPIPVVGDLRVFDSPGGAVIASEAVNVAGTPGGAPRTHGIDLPLATGDLLDGIGVIYYRLPGGFLTDVISVTVQGRNDPLGTADTFPVEASLRVAGDNVSVPEPSTFALLGAGLGLLWFGRRKRGLQLSD